MTATTALTAQNTKGVKDIHHIPASFVEKQIEACVEDIGVDVVKTGEPLLSLRVSPFLSLSLCVLLIAILEDESDDGSLTFFWKGMLAGEETIEMISRMIVKHNIPALVVDPVRSPL